MPYSCPSCGRTRIRRSMRAGIIDAIMRFIMLAPYRCRSCRKRFFAWAVR